MVLPLTCTTVLLPTVPVMARESPALPQMPHQEGLTRELTLTEPCPFFMES